MRRKEKMMKKLLIFMLVLGMASLANATIVGLHIDSAAPGGSVATQLGPSGTAIVWVTVDTTAPTGSPLNLGSLDVLIGIDGGGATGTIVNALNPLDIVVGHFYGAQATWYGAPPPAPPLSLIGGWGVGMTPPPIYGAGNQSVEIGAGQFGVQVYATSYPPMAVLPPDGVSHFAPWLEGAIGYVEIHCLGAGDITISIAGAQSFGGTIMDDGITVPGFGASTTVYQIPEPMTVLLLGLGGLFLRRRK